MDLLPLPFSTLQVMQVLAALVLAILFLQSSLDKVIDRQGNLEYLTGHFAKSPLAKTVGPMFLVITLLELAAGALNGIGAILVLMGGSTLIALWGAVIAGVALSALFFGQRVAKDYAGAATLVPYFLLALAAMWLQGVGRPAV